MKKLVIMLFACFGLMSACKDKDNNQDTDMDATQPAATTADTISDTATTQPIDNPEPGVEKSGSQEQVP